MTYKNVFVLFYFANSITIIIKWGKQKKSHKTRDNNESNKNLIIIRLNSSFCAVDTAYIKCVYCKSPSRTPSR